MTTSLASSPMLPIVMAGAAGLLIVGTLSYPNKASSEPTANESPAAEVPPPLTGDTVPAACKGKVCTITFPKAGDSAQVFGGTVQAIKFYVDGAEVSIAGESVVSSLKVAGKATGYTLKIVKVDPAAGVTVRITKK
ncbi:MAG TPA: hypothetical protein VEG38_21585 [Acidimicrobiia bacterium]|nr:hypothetical protein [Acidimicrobiia bacterium]